MFEELDVVSLVRDIPESNLSAGSLGSIVQKITNDQFEVEFVDTEGITTALLTLKSSDLRCVWPVMNNDLKYSTNSEAKSDSNNHYWDKNLKIDRSDVVKDSTFGFAFN